MEEKPRSPQHNIELNEDEEFEWQTLVDSVDATDIPFNILKYLRVTVIDGSRLIFPIAEWVESGEDLDYIEDRVTNWYKTNEDRIAGSDYVIDLFKIKQEVTSYTKHLLKDLE